MNANDAQELQPDVTNLPNENPSHPRHSLTACFRVPKGSSAAGFMCHHLTLSPRVEIGSRP